MDRVRFEDVLGQHKRTVDATTLAEAVAKLPGGRLPYGWLAIPEYAKPVSREYDAQAAHIEALEAALAECKPCNCWRKGNVLPRGERMPVTLQSLQDAWDRDQGLMYDQAAEISKLKQRINNLEQARLKI